MRRLLDGAPTIERHRREPLDMAVGAHRTPRAAPLSSMIGVVRRDAEGPVGLTVPDPCPTADPRPTTEKETMPADAPEPQ
jgi:hypothetical protein